MGNYFKTIWTETAKAQLRSIHDYLKYDKHTPQGAANVKKDLLNAVKTISFEEQYQKDEFQTEYRRIIVRQYKIIYKVENDTVYVMRIFRTTNNPNKQEYL